MLPNTIKEYGEIRKSLKPLLEGIVLCIDPSCGSKGPTGSLPGWAVSKAGELLASGVIELPVEEDLWVRLQSLHHGLRKLVSTYQPDVLVYEQIAPRRYGGGSAHSHASLLKSVGVVLSVSGPTTYIGLRPTIWTKCKRSSYIKSDEGDAIEMLYVALSSAQYISENDPPRSYGKKSKEKSNGTSKSSKGSKPKKAARVRISEGTSKPGATGTTTQKGRRRREPVSRTRPEVPPF